MQTHPPLQVQPGVTCPDPGSLRTGDLLFPRAPDGEAKQTVMWRMLLGEIQPLEVAASVFGIDEANKLDPRILNRPLEMTVREAIGPLLERVEHDQPLLPFQSPDLPPDAMRTHFKLRIGLNRSRTEFDPTNPTHLALLLKILKAEFQELFREWLNMSVSQFILHPISKILIDALNGDVNSGLFVGHVGMVVEEPAHGGRDAKLMVYEGNVTDFSAYETRAKLYQHPDDPPSQDGEPGRMHGWVGFRHAQGNMVWAARPALLDTLDRAGTEQATRHAAEIRAAIRRSAKELTGIGYGFFDDPQLGDQGRLYCSEFVRSILLKVSGDLGLGPDLDLKGNTTWNWMVDNIQDPDFKQKVRDALHAQGGRLWKYVDGKDFFIYTVQMAWRTDDVRQNFTPVGQGGYG